MGCRDCLSPRWIGLDVRSLALFRVALAFALLADQLNHLLDAPTFLSDAGFLPRGTIHEHLQTGDYWRWSLYFMNGSVAFANLLQLAHLSALCSVLVGWHARTSAAVAFVLHTSQFNRTEITRHAFDYLGGGMLFWSISLPIADAASVDAVHRRLEPLRRGRGRGAAWLGGKSRPTAERRLVLSVGTVAIWLQVWVMYFCAMTAKTDRAWTRDHTALQLSLQMGYLIRPWSIRMLHHEPLCRLLTALAIPIEYVLPVMLLLPSPPLLHLMLRGAAAGSKCRLPSLDDTAPSARPVPPGDRAASSTPERHISISEACGGLRSPPQAAPTSRRFHLQPTGTAIFGLVGFHCGIAATMALGIIPWLNMAAVLAFVPASAWDALGQARDREAKAGAKEQGGYGGWLETPSTLRRHGPIHMYAPARWLQGLGPLLRTPERRPRRVEARRGL